MTEARPPLLSRRLTMTFREFYNYGCSALKGVCSFYTFFDRRKKPEGHSLRFFCAHFSEQLRKKGVLCYDFSKK